MSGALWLQAVLALLAVLGLAALAAGALRMASTRLGFPLGAPATARGRARRLSVVERRMADPRTALLLLRADDVEYVVLATAQGPLLLDRRPAREVEG